MKTHELKTENPFFERCWLGDKTFEVRKNDRDFQSGDKIILKEYDAEIKTYSGREIVGRITYVLYNFPAIQEGYVVFSFHVTDWV